MLGARSACFYHLFPQCLSRAVDPDSRIARRNPGTFRQFVKITLSEVYDPDRLAIFSFERTEEFRDAAADIAFRAGARRLARRGLTPPGFCRPFGGSAMPVMIHDRIPQNTIEPCDNAFLGANPGTAPEAPDKSRLKNVLGHRTRLYAGFQKREKAPVAVYQNLDRLG
jgi:hypothetical protein